MGLEEVGGVGRGAGGRRLEGSQDEREGERERESVGRCVGGLFVTSSAISRNAGGINTLDVRGE